MLGWLQNWRHSRVVSRSTVPAEAWQAAFARLPILSHLSPAEQSTLRQLAILFMHEKTFYGTHDLEVTEAMRLLIALQACLPILRLGIEWYSDWESIIVYPAGFAPTREVEDEHGLVHTVTEELAGEAWHRGPVLLSWEDSAESGFSDGYNVVIHEFIHKLDMRNGDADGFPPMHDGIDAEAWADAYSQAYEDFLRDPKAGIDPYAATDPAEFFAVTSEVFFEDPQLLQEAYPRVYGVLKRFFKQNPMSQGVNHPQH